MKNSPWKWFRRITGISTPLGGISWTPGAGQPDIETFDDVFCITLAENQSLVEFLHRNDGRIVFMNADLDATVALDEQWARVESEHIDLDRIGGGDLNGLPIALPNKDQRLVGVTFYFREGRVLNASHGGTGVLMVNIAGFFDVSTTFHGGPSTAFHLKEVDAPLALRAEFMRRTREKHDD